LSLYKNISWSTKSNAFCRSKNTVPIYLPLSTSFSQESIKWIRAVLHEWFFRNPDCLLYKIFVFWKKCCNWLAMWRSKNLKYWDHPSFNYDRLLETVQNRPLAFIGRESIYEGWLFYVEVHYYIYIFKSKYFQSTC
jgi:hypothetical protein